MHSDTAVLVDTHVHICDSTFDSDRDEVIDRAGKAGVGALIAVGENLADARKNLSLAEIYPMIRPAAGLYPAIVDLDMAEEMIAFIHRHHRRLVAIGEVGLDFWVVKETAKKELQKEIFERFIQLSEELDLPLNVHSRSAGRHAIDLLLANNARRVQMHAFDGKSGAAQPAVEAGYFFSIPPSAIRSRQKQKLVKQLPLSCLLAETDSPVLGPVPNERNQPANLTFSIRAIAEIKGISVEEVTAAVTDNAGRLFGFL